MERFTSFDGTGIAYQVWGTASSSPPVVRQHGFVVDATTNFVGPGVVAALVAAGRDDALAARPEVLAAAIPGARWRLVSGDHMTALRAPAYAPAIVEFLAS